MTIPVLLVESEGVAEDAVAALRSSPRVQLFRAAELGAAATAFSARTARATIVATMHDPFEELVLVRTSGFVGPLIFAINSTNARFSEQAREAGVLACLTLPIVETELEPVLDIVEALPTPPTNHAPLGLFLDAIDRTARHGESVVRLSQREFALLHCLMRSGTRPVPIAQIHDYVWGGWREGTSAREIVDVNVSQLRRKLQRIGLGNAIRTYRNFGYGLAGEPTPE